MSILTQGSNCLLFLAVFLVVNQYPGCSSLHIYGEWDPDQEFFLFLAKFGFQKTELSNKNDTQGFIFGNITAIPSSAGRLARLPSIPPAALIPKVRVPRAAINFTSNSTDKTSAPKEPAKVLPLNQTQSSNVSNSSHVPSNSPVFSETFVHPSKSSLPSKKINFSATPSSSKPAEPLQAPPTKGSSTTTTSTSSPASSTSSPPSKSTQKPSSTTSKAPSSTSTTTTKAPLPPAKFYPATLVVLDRGFFIDFYKNRLIEDRDVACKRMFERIAHVAHDPYCFPAGTENLLKRVPCPKDKICIDDQITNNTVVKGHQFTYAISDLSKAKFWYVSLVPCFRNPVTCEWEYSRNITSIDYDIYLVNGNPYTKNQNPLEYQFSFDRQDTVEIYLVFFLCYLILVPLQIHAVLRQRHIVPKLFTTSVALELTAVTSNVIHVLKFAVNGEGHPGLAGFGDVTDIIARAIFMLILLVLAKGWAVTRTELTSKPFIFSIWAAYGVVHILLYVWKETEVDVIEDIDEYQTWPGWLILILRTFIMLWFLYELKDTMDHEHQPHKLNFFLHFGAAALVWFIYLPIVALIALQVSPLWRSKFLLGITYSADCLAFAIMTHLLWPTRTEQYFLLMSKDAILTDELEEFNEAPHVVNSYARRPNQWYPVNYSFHDVSSPEAVSLTQGNTLHNMNHQYPHQRFSNGANAFAPDDVKDNVPLIIT